MRWNWLRQVLNFVGGAMGRAAGTGLALGVFLVLFQMTPAELVVAWWSSPPVWVASPWTNFGVLVVGLVIIFGSLRFNLWDQRQKAIDGLAEEVSWAISEALLNRSFPTHALEGEDRDAFVARWERDYRAWCDGVSKRLENRAFFTRADQLHFDRLGFIQPVGMTGHERHDWLLSQLRLKFDRLREVINWVQMRRN